MYLVETIQVKATEQILPILFEVFVEFNLGFFSNLIV